MADPDAGQCELYQLLTMLRIERAGFEQQPAGNPAEPRLSDELLVERIDGVRRAREFEIFLPDLSQHPPVFGCGLPWLGDDTQEVQCAPAALPLRIELLQIVDQIVRGACPIFQFMFHDPAFPGQIRRYRQARLHGGKELCFLLHHLGESLFDKAVQYFIDLLPRNMRAGRYFESLESGMPQQNQVRSGFIGI